MGKPLKHYYPITDLPGEEWRDVVGYDGYYQVSNMGRVKGLARYDCRGRWFGERLLGVTFKGTVKVSVEARKVYLHVATLVGDAFFRERGEHEILWRKNDDLTDNQVQNFEITTISYRRRVIYDEGFRLNLHAKGLRRCNVCKEDKLLSAFHNFTKGYAGKGYRCKMCTTSEGRRFDTLRRMTIHAPQ